MKTENVQVMPYDPGWESDFNQIKTELENTIGELIVGIEHVGSTAVKGLSAKPCIDIDVIIRDSSVFPIVCSKLAEIGYIHEGNLGIKDREAFRYTDKPHLQLHHLYVCTKDSAELHRHITFRNFLRNNEDAVKMYSSVKEKAAESYPNNIAQYMEYKSSCIESLYKQCELK